jgi:UDP-glucose-4-epimerase GalE
MTVLVVGGAGYIGSHAASALQRCGENVILYDNLSTGHKRLAAGHELIVADIHDANELAKVMPRVDAVMHFAAHAYVGESVENPQKYFQNNVVAGLVLLDAAVRHGVRNLVFSSTCAVYGIPHQIPIRETAPRDPVNPYGVSKLFFEQALEAYRHAYGLRYACLRYFNAAGADEEGHLGELHAPETHLIPLALAAASGNGGPLSIFGENYPTPDGTCIRDYIHVNDLAEAHVLALQTIAASGQSHALNLGTGKGYSIREVLSAVKAITGREVPCKVVAKRAGDPPVLIADPAKAEAVLGWKAQRTLSTIVSTAWDWMQQQSAITA